MISVVEGKEGEQLVLLLIHGNEMLDKPTAFEQSLDRNIHIFARLNEIIKLEESNGELRKNGAINFAVPLREKLSKTPSAMRFLHIFFCGFIRFLSLNNFSYG